MTLQKLQGMLRLHKSAYKAFLRFGKIEQAAQAKALMIETYLKIRAMRA